LPKRWGEARAKGGRLGKEAKEPTLGKIQKKRQVTETPWLDDQVERVVMVPLYFHYMFLLHGTTNPKSSTRTRRRELKLIINKRQ
jgi:hypothetical protein